MNSKSLLIPVAAFAVAVTGVQAFNTAVLEEAGLTDDQIEAFEEAKELRKDGDRDGARDVLSNAGIDEETLKSLREAMREHRAERRELIHEALENNDYDAFQDAVEGSPLADIITTEDDFEIFKEAHELREAGEREEAKAIMTELGFDGKKHKGKRGHRGHL